MYSLSSARSATMFGTTPGMIPYVPPPAPPKNAPARYRSRSASLVPFRDESRLVALRYDQTVQAEPPIPIPPPRSSRRPPPRPISTDTARSPIVIPPPRPAPPTEQHPALRTISSPRTSSQIRRRDSAHSPTTPSSSWTIREDSETDDEDPFAYENVKGFHEIKPLQLRTRSASPSLYSRQEERVSESNSRVSDPSISPALSDGETVSPTSPTTPPSNFSKRFARSFSLRSNSSKSSFPKMKRLRKKLANDGGSGAETPGYPLNGQNGSAPKSPSGRLSPLPDPHESPIISTTIPTESLLEDDFMTQLSFSKRGSIIFGGKHPRRSIRNVATMADQDSGIGNENIGPEPPREPRAFPLVPVREKGIDDVPVASAKESTKHSGAHDLTDTPPTPRRLPPSVRVISAEAEKESQKVRSLYESGEGLNWEEGGRRSSIDERPQPSAEHPREENEKDAYGFLIYPTYYLYSR
ncbi:hypothetical protein M434DRAFT_344164 [Hypoxylon sp. CO27-5]|nr:hypothetical protein M434DRAFT_344164 [Hypoxylon sp. CO27-5]